MAIQRYLKTGIEVARGKEVIQINTDIVQAANTPVWGHLCLFVLKSLVSGEKYQTILDHMQHYGGGYTQSYWEDTIQTEYTAIQGPMGVMTSTIEITRVENQNVIVKCYRN